MTRRRPVPREWREDHHYLTTWVSSRVVGLRGHVRTRGRCQCGAEWPSSANTDNLHYADVVDSWNDHVEAEFYSATIEAVELDPPMHGHRLGYALTRHGDGAQLFRHPWRSHAENFAEAAGIRLRLTTPEQGGTR